MSIIGRPRRAVADLLREAEIMPWRRMLLPLLFVRGRLAAVPGIATAADFVAAPDEDGLECGFECASGIFDMIIISFPNAISH